MSKIKDAMLGELDFKNIEIDAEIQRYTCIGCGDINKKNNNQLCWGCWWDCEVRDYDLDYSMEL